MFIVTRLSLLYHLLFGPQWLSVLACVSTPLQRDLSLRKDLYVYVCASVCVCVGEGVLVAQLVTGTLRFDRNPVEGRLSTGRRRSGW
jgi:hypothetical protein